MTKRAVLYARVSGDDTRKDNRNLQGQIEMCRQYALSHGWTVVAELAEDDRGASGASFELPQLNRVLEMAKAREIDYVVVREIDRFSRRLAKQLIIEEQLKRNGVSIEYVLGEYPDTPEGNLMKNVKSSVAEYERLKINERMIRGRRQNVKAGSIVSGRSPYGYRLVVSEGNKRHLEVYEPEAKVVRMMFRWYIEGEGDSGPWSFGKITNKLTDLRIPTYADTRPVKMVKKRGRGEWCKGMVRNLIRNQTYAGVWHYGKTERTSGRFVIKDRDGLPSVEVPAIISQEQWDAAQARLEYNRKNLRRKPKYDFLLSGRLHCRRCMKSMTRVHSKPRSDGSPRHYYRCWGNHHAAVKCTMHTNFPQGQMDEAVWNWVKSFLTDPEALLDGLSSYRKEQETAKKPLRDRLSILCDLISDRQQQMERLLDLYVGGDIPKDMLLERRKRLEDELAKLNAEQAHLTHSVEDKTITDEQVLEIKAFAEQVAQGLDAAANNFSARRRIIEMLNVRGSVDVENEEKVVYVECALGESSLYLSVTNTHRRRRKDHAGFVLIERLVLQPTASHTRSTTKHSVQTACSVEDV